MRLATVALLQSCAALHGAIPRRARHRCDAAATDDEGGVWDARSWRLAFDVGRTEGDESMPDDWAASGARMAFSVDVEVSADDASSKDAEVGRGALALRLPPALAAAGSAGLSEREAKGRVDASVANADGPVRCHLLRPTILISMLCSRRGRDPNSDSCAQPRRVPEASRA